MNQEILTPNRVMIFRNATLYISYKVTESSRLRLSFFNSQKESSTLDFYLMSAKCFESFFFKEESKNCFLKIIIN